MRRRHLESVSSRSLAGRGSWGTAPSVFWYGAPGGTQGPLGKGGAAERWRVTPSVSGVTRHRAQPATTRTHKRNASAASGANYAFAKGSAPPTGEMILWHNLCHQSSGSLRSPPPFTQGRLWDGALPLHRGGYGLGRDGFGREKKKLPVWGAFSMYAYSSCGSPLGWFTM